jgi:hypothetical protein
MSKRTLMPNGACRIQDGGFLLRGEHTKESAVAMLNTLVAAGEFESGCWDDSIDRSVVFEPTSFHWFKCRWWRWVPEQFGGVRMCEAEPNARGAFVAAFLGY